MANKKKITTSVVAVATAAALILGGTFAWQSISQTALNETDATINPGGRLHDDFNGENKDVYVENFADEDIFARVRLDEYLELTFNKGTDVQETQIITTGATKDETDTYITHKFSTENATDEFFTWNVGGETVYMPTFNKNKDSLTADVNGTMDYTDAEGNAKPYGDYVTYTEGETVTDDAVYDADTNTVDEFADDSAQENINYVLVNEEHTAAKTGKAQLISMEEWLALESDTDNYWVYDTDGWVYYSSPIKPSTATGLLLDGIELNQVMDDSYYYAINVVGQFITADDLGKDDNTGFYADADNLPSDNALALLEKIGVKVNNEEKPFLYTYNATQKGAYTVIDFGIIETVEDDENNDLIEVYFYNLGNNKNAKCTEENRFDKVTIAENSYMQESYYGGVNFAEADETILIYNAAQVAQNYDGYYLGVKMVALEDGSKKTLEPIWVEPDKTAPVVTDVITDKATHTITISDISDIDFPLKMTVYKCKNSTDLTYDYEGIYEMIDITKDDDGNLNYKEDVYFNDIFQFKLKSMEFSGNDIVIKCDIRANSSSDCYLGFTVEDMSSNEGTVSAPIKLNYIVAGGEVVPLNFSTENYSVDNSITNDITISYNGNTLYQFSGSSNSVDNTESITYITEDDQGNSDAVPIAYLSIDYTNNNLQFYSGKAGTYVVSCKSLGSVTINVAN